MRPFCRDQFCRVPEPHRHRPPTDAELAEAVYTIEVRHAPRCEWRNDIYGACSCGVTAAETALYDAMRPREGGPK